LPSSRYDNAIVGPKRLAYLTREIIAKMNLNSERDSLQFGECFAVLPEATGMNSLSSNLLCDGFLLSHSLEAPPPTKLAGLRA
jgi:hypothetical protein